MEIERPIARISAAAVVLMAVGGLLYMAVGEGIERIDPELLAAISAIAGAAAMFLWSPMDRRD